MAKYFIVLILQVLFATYLTFPLGVKYNFVYILNNIRKRDSIIGKTNRIFISIILFCNILGAYTLYESVPLVKDFPYAIQNKYDTIIGIVTEKNRNVSENNPYLQDIIINNQEYYIYLKGRVQKGNVYEIKYLPNSKFVIDIKLL